MVGRTLGRYRIVDEIGAGGMGVVYRAHDERLDRDVALKIITPGTLGDEAARKRFRREALALSKLNHPNVATVFDFDTQDGVDFLVMELVEGQSVADRLAIGPLPEAEALRLGGQLLDGLAAAHSANIVHRDLKPGNLRVTPEGRLKILDFGLAKVLRPALTTAATMSDSDQLAIGTLPYMPPEQLSGGVVDARADIYAAGAVLYEMAAGQRAFPDPSGPRLVDAILHQMPVAPTAVNESISPAFASVILKALDKDPDRRYQTARELSVDIDRLRNPGSVAAAPAPRRQLRLRLPSLRWLTAGAAATIAATALIFSLVGGDSALSFAPRDWILVADFDNQTGNALFDRSLATAFTVGLEQSTHANVIPRPRLASALKRMGKTSVDRIDESLAREISIRENVRLFVASGISRVGNQYALTSRLVSSQTGETVRSYMETASDETLLIALGKVAAAIRRDLGESLASLDASNRPLPQVTTPSLDALQHYAEAFHLWTQGNHDQAVQRYEAAIKLDSDFAMAHAKLGICYYSYVYNDPVRGRQHSEKALALADRVTERERLLISATYKGNLGYSREALAAYDLYLKAYPDDYTQRYNYGNQLRDARQYEEAAKQYREVIRTVPDHASSHINLAVSLVSLDRNTEALEHYARAFVIEPDWITSGVLNHEYGFVLIKAGNEQKARQVFDMALAKPATKAAALRSIALLELTHGRYSEAKTRLTEAILDHAAANRTLSKARDHTYLAVVLDGMGDARGSVKELDLAAALIAKTPQQLWMGATIGGRLARAGEPGKAVALEKLMASHADLKSEADRSSLHRLQAEIALAKGNRPASIELFQLAHRENESSLALEGLAFASAQAGQANEAIARYEALIGSRDRSLGWEAQPGWYDAHYRLASLYAGRGNAVRARELLTALLTYWKDGDPDLPLVLRARRLQDQISR